MFSLLDRIILRLTLAIFIICQLACHDKAGPENPTHELKLKKDTSSIEVTQPFQVSYSKITVAALDSLPAFAIENILALNRIDRKFLRSHDSLMVPDTLVEKLIFYAPFPHSVNVPEHIARLVVVSLRLQAFAAYDSAKLVRWGPVSSGKTSTPTPSGLFYTNWKSKRTISTENPEWMLNWYFNIENRRGISIHEYDLPGYPASHSCIRMRGQDAKWLYGWAKQWRLSGRGAVLENGTPVVIYGFNNFGRKKQIWRTPALYNSNMLQDQEDLQEALQVLKSDEE